MVFLLLALAGLLLFVTTFRTFTGLPVVDGDFVISTLFLAYSYPCCIHGFSDANFLYLIHTGTVMLIFFCCFQIFGLHEEFHFC